MVPDAEAAGRELAAFRARRSPSGRFLSYARGRARHFVGRQMMVLFCFGTVLWVTDPWTALAAAILVMTADALDTGLLRRLGRTAPSAARLSAIHALTAVTAGLHALSVGVVLALVMAAGGDAARTFALAICLANMLDAALLFALHRAATLARLAVLGLALVGIFASAFDGVALGLGGTGLGRAVRDLLVSAFGGGPGWAIGPSIARPAPDQYAVYFEMMAGGLLSFILLAFLRHVQRSRRRADREREVILEEALERAKLTVALEASRAEAKRLATVAEEVRESIVVTDPDGIITWVNPGFTATMGYALRDVVGQHVRLLNGPASNVATVERLMSARAEARAERTQIINRRKDGAPIWMETSLTPVVDRNGSVTSFISVERDISHIKERERALAAASRSAAEANRAKQAFLATITHEIRTPLNGILGNVELLQGTRLDAAQGNMVKVIADSGEALLLLVNDVLDLSALEAGRLTVQATQFEVAATLESIAALMRPLAERKDLRFEVVGLEALPSHLVGDGPRLRQVLANLIGNAIKFTARGGIQMRVTCQTGAGDAPATHCALQIDIEDTGIGIQADRLEGIFESFERAPPGVANRFGGTGLGLSISRQLVRAMGGTLSARSTVGSGSVFTIALSLPIAAGALRAPRKGPSGADAPLADAPSTESERSDAQTGDRPPLSAPTHPSTQGVESESSPTRDQPRAPPGRSTPVQSDPNSRDRAETSPTTLCAPNQDGLLGASALAPVNRPFAGETMSGMPPTVGVNARDAAPRLRGLRILLAEDNASNLHLLTTLLKPTGAELHTARSGAEALLRYRDTPLDAVVMDMRMPDLDGPTATRAIRALEGAAGLSPIPILALTGDAMPQARAACMDAGMSGFLVKPVTRAALVEALAGALDGTRTAPLAGTMGSPPMNLQSDTQQDDTVAARESPVTEAEGHPPELRER